MRHPYAIFITCIICLLRSMTQVDLYAQQWHTTIDIRRPAERPMPKEITDLLMVNNTAVQPQDFGHATVVMGSKIHNESIDLTTAAQRTLFGAARELDNTELFASVGVIDKTLAKGSFFSSSSFNKTLSDSLCLLYNADAVLSLDKLVIYDKQEVMLNNAHDYLAYLEVYVSSAWTLYCYKNNEIKVTTFTHSDTLYWEGVSYDSQLALQHLPDRQTALLDVAEYTGERFAKQHTPQWETADRYLYENTDSLMNAGIHHFTHRCWEQAADTWQQAYENAKSMSKKSKTKYETCAYAAADIAVTNEILGDLPTAILWAKRSVDDFAKLKTSNAAQQRVNMSYYLQQLQQREKDEKKLSEQQ